MKLKRFLSRILCLALIFGVLPIALAAEKPPSQAGERKLSGGQRDFLWPVPGAYNLSSCFLDNRAHYSLDIAAPDGTAVVASYAGEVIKIYTDCEHNWGKSGNCCSSWGNYVLMEHSYSLNNGETIVLYSRYAHLSKVFVSVGKRVAQGEKIGAVGSTGRSSGPHLDYEILWGGTSPSSKYSLDPYMNELLELPEELHTTFGKCCQEYVAYVKTYYPRCSHSQFNSQGSCVDCGYEFNWKSTWDSDSMGVYTATEDTTAFEIPYSQEDGGVTISKDTAVSVNATVINGLGEAWQEVVQEEGKIGYVPEASLAFADYFESKIEGNLSTLEEGQILKQESHRVDGRIASLYPLRKISGYLDGEQYATWTGRGGTRQVDLRGTAINKKLSFAELSAGMHTLTIVAEDSTGRDGVEVVRCSFYIEEPPQPSQPEGTEPTQPEPTVPPETQPEPTEPTETQPVETQSEPTQPTATEEYTTEPSVIPTVPAADPVQPQETEEKNDYSWMIVVVLGAAVLGGVGCVWIRSRKETGKYL